ncbi:unnamed protein product, partial [Schistosoma curassoni]|uniref:Innexin n=1 Tax=Schistosoma curassoni TaxID=6186 RepID=A0A183KSR5_9TREM
SDFDSCINIAPNVNGQTSTTAARYHSDKTKNDRFHDEIVRFNDGENDDTDIEENEISRVTRRYRNTVNILKCVRYTGTFLSLIYLLVKLFYLCNSVGQLFLMQYFLGFTNYNSSLFGMSILYNILHGQDWRSTLIFPRVAYCYAPVKHLGTKVNTATAQCVLPVNMLNEKIYIFLWWWILLVCVVNFHSLLRWCLQFACQNRGCQFVINYIKLSNVLTSSELYFAEKFARKFLRRDGMFLLRMLALNAGEMVTSDIVNEMWLNYRRIVIEPVVENHKHHSQRLNPNESSLDRGSKTDSSTITNENGYLGTSESSALKNNKQDNEKASIELIDLPGR